MRKSIIFLLTVISMIASAQPVLKIGDMFPSILLRNIINAPVSQLDVQANNKKFLIFNFWGTWCTPCLPEMDSLSKLQQQNMSTIQVIAISDEPVARLENYLKRTTFKGWLASDTTLNLYKQFGFNYVGQSAVIDRKGRIVTLVRTDSINQRMIDRLLKNEPIRSSAETGNIVTAEPGLSNIDSTYLFNVSLSAFHPGAQSMSKGYLNSVFEGRRKTYVNLCLTTIIREAYQVSPSQMIFDFPEKEICDWDNKSTLYCFDLLVNPEQKDSLYEIFKQTLNRLLPVKARSEKRSIPVYVLQRLPDTGSWPVSKNTETSIAFSGRGFDGKAITIKPFADYISNEMDLPLVDETGLTGRYDITTENTLRTKEDVIKALQKLGLSLVKENRDIEVVIISRQSSKK